MAVHTAPAASISPNAINWRGARSVTTRMTKSISTRARPQIVQWKNCTTPCRPGPAGSTRGLFLDPLDPSLPEDEILLPRSTQLLVKSVKRDKSGRVDVVVEVLPDG